MTQPVDLIPLFQKYPGFVLSNICTYYRGALRVRPPRWRHTPTELTTSPFHFAHFLLYVPSFHPELMPSTQLSFHFGRERFVSFFSLKCDRDDSSHLLSAQSPLMKNIHPLAQECIGTPLSEYCDANTLIDHPLRVSSAVYLDRRMYDVTHTLVLILSLSLTLTSSPFASRSPRERVCSAYVQHL
jgi:hypothetical protein